MVNKIVTLKDSTGTDNCYPITPVDAVFVDSNTALSDALDDKADADMSNVLANTIPASKINLSTFNFGNYSTTEKDTGFTWIDGSHIYKKTINFGALPNNTTKDVAHGISNLAEVIRIEGTVRQNGNDWNYKPIPLMYPNADASYNTECAVNGSNVSMRCSNNRSGCSAYVTIYYTKSS